MYTRRCKRAVVVLWLHVPRVNKAARAGPCWSAYPPVDPHNANAVVPHGSDDSREVRPKAIVVLAVWVGGVAGGVVVHPQWVAIAVSQDVACQVWVPAKETSGPAGNLSFTVRHVAARRIEL